MPDRKTNKTPRNGAARGGGTQPMTGAYFLSLELENVRCFSKKQVLDLSDGNGRPARWTILLGENGTGKTTALQVLAAHSRIFELASGISAGIGEEDDLVFHAPGTRRLLRRARDRKTYAARNGS